MSKEQQIFQFNQSERNETCEIPLVYKDGYENKWNHIKRMLLIATEVMMDHCEGDFEVIIRRKNDE